MRFAFASIFARDDGDRLPAFTCCVARAFAFAAWARSGMGYFFAPGNPNVDLLRLFRDFVVSLLIPFPPPNNRISRFRNAQCSAGCPIRRSLFLPRNAGI